MLQLLTVGVTIQHESLPGVWFLWVANQPWHLGAGTIHGLEVASALMFFYGVIYTVHYEIYASRVATLKEIKRPSRLSRRPV
jgi:hypothetical protein